jgi:hypothetical protein
MMSATTPMWLGQSNEKLALWELTQGFNIWNGSTDFLNGNILIICVFQQMKKHSRLIILIPRLM